MSRVEPIERLFLHFYDPHFFEDRKKKVVGNKSGQSPVEPEARLASRIAVLAAREVLIPAASFIEVAECRATVLELASLFEMGKIRLVGSGGPSLADYAGEKLLQYDPDGSRYPIYAAINDLPVESPPVPHAKELGYPRRGEGMAGDRSGHTSEPDRSGSPWVGGNVAGST